MEKIEVLKKKYDEKEKILTEIQKKYYADKNDQNNKEYGNAIAKYNTAKWKYEIELFKKNPLPKLVGEVAYD